MPRPKDVHLNTNGDLELGANGDIKCAYDDDVTIDGIIFRLKTYAGDYSLEPACGASLEDFVGMPNTRELGEKIKARALSAITRDGFVSASNVQIDVFPLSAEELAVIVNVQGSKNTYMVASSLDLLTGRLKVAT